MQEEEQAIRWDVHPDLALMKHGEKEEILCLVLQADEKQARALYALGAFCIYRQGARTALLYEQRMNLTEQLAACLGEHGLQAGLSGPFALPASARGCMLKAQLALEILLSLFQRILI